MLVASDPLRPKYGPDSGRAELRKVAGVGEQEDTWATPTMLSAYR